MNITLWHCKDSRSFRPLWALEELEVDFQLEQLRFPPRVFEKEFLEINPLGTVPFFVDGETRMTESSAICHYLVERYQRHDLRVETDHPEFGDYLNWLYHSDATLTFPLSLVLRYDNFEPDERKQPQVAEDYRKWYLARLRKLDAHLKERSFLCDNRFTMADIAVGYALYLGEAVGLADQYAPQTRAYLERLKQRPGFQRAQARSAGMPSATL